MTLTPSLTPRVSASFRQSFAWLCNAIMALFVARSRAHRPLTVCEVCLKHLRASPKPTTSYLRFLSVATRPPAPRRIFDSETAASSISRARSREHSSAAAPNESSAATDNATNGAFLSQGPIAALSLPPEARCARLDNRRLIAVSGPDAAKFLQGLVTNNVDPQARAPFYAAFLDARGRMLHDVFVWTYPDLHRQKEMIGTKGAGEWACYIEVQESEVGALAKHLKRHKLRSKVDIKVVEDESTDTTLQVWAIWGGHKALEAISDQFEVITTMKDPRFILDNKPKNPSEQPTMDRALLIPKQQSAQVAGHYEEYTRLRYSYGVVEGDEIPKETHPTNKGSSLPMEYNVDISQGIDFKKGCYVGQELTIRTKHTGVVRKRVLPVALSKADARQAEFESSQQVPKLVEGFNLDPVEFESSDIKQLDENGQIKKGRATGKIISVAGNLGLALCRLEMMTPMKVSAEGGSWKPGMEFAIANAKGEVVKLKPFLRDEWVARVRDLWDRKRERI